MAETPPSDTQQYWCYHCDKRVTIEALTDLPDIICFECKNGFVESISAAPQPTTTTTTNRNQDPSFSNQFLQILRLIAEAARDDDNPPPPPVPAVSDPGDFLRIELNEWNNNDHHDDSGGHEVQIDFDNNNNHIIIDDADRSENNDIANDEDEDEDEDDDDEEEDEEEEEEEEEEGEEEGEEEEVYGFGVEQQAQEDFLRRPRDLLRLRIRDFASRGDRLLNWSDFLTRLEDHTMEFRVEMPQFDGYVGNPQDYLDADGYEALLQNLAESSDGARRGAPPASKSAISGLESVQITAQDECLVCAICKEAVPVGEEGKKMPCGHGYHGECIETWLGSRNTCPICRFELPTEDPDYEEQRQTRSSSSATAGGSSNSGFN